MITEYRAHCNPEEEETQMKTEQGLLGWHTKIELGRGR